MIRKDVFPNITILNGSQKDSQQSIVDDGQSVSSGRSWSSTQWLGKGKSRDSSLSVKTMDKIRSDRRPEKAQNDQEDVVSAQGMEGLSGLKRLWTQKSTTVNEEHSMSGKTGGV